LGLATYNYYLFYLPCFDQVLLTTPALTGAVYFLLKYDHDRQRRWLLLAGPALAGAVLSRPTSLAILPPVMGWLYLNRHTQNGAAGRTAAGQGFWSRAGAVSLLALPVLVAVFPFTWHNYRVSGHFSLLSDNFGVNLYTGNNPDAAGLDSLIQPQSQPAVLRFQVLYPRVVAGETTLTAEVLRYVSEQPGDWLALLARKTWLWFGAADEPLVSPFFPLSIDPQAGGYTSRTLARLPLEWQAMAVAACLGLLPGPARGRSRRRIGLLWLVYGVFSAATILFFIQLRFRLPFAPFVILSGASLLALAGGWYRRQPWRFRAVLLGLLLLYPLVPGLWLFILLFTGLGLWPVGSMGYSPRRSLRAMGRIAIPVCLYLLAVGVWLKAEALAADISQTIDHYLGPPVAAGSIVGQTFQMDCDGLHQVEITLGVFGDEHDRPVTFYLAADPSAQAILYSESFDARPVRDHQTKRFSFPPIAGSAGRSFFFFLTSPTSTLENALTGRGYTDTPVDRYPAGRAWAGRPDNLQPLQADFAFGAFCDLSSWQKVWDVFRRPVTPTRR
jgi:hypothetical protein